MFANQYNKTFSIFGTYPELLTQWFCKAQELFVAESAGSTWQDPIKRQLWNSSIGEFFHTWLWIHLLYIPWLFRLGYHTWGGTCLVRSFECMFYTRHLLKFSGEAKRTEENYLLLILSHKRSIIGADSSHVLFFSLSQGTLEFGDADTNLPVNRKQAKIIKCFCSSLHSYESFVLFSFLYSKPCPL